MKKQFFANSLSENWFCWFNTNQNHWILRTRNLLNTRWINYIQIFLALCELMWPFFLTFLVEFWQWKEEMFSIPSFYEVGSDCYDNIGGVLSDSENTKLSPRSMAEAKAVAASTSHKEAERRRRKRINTHIATLKSILPNTIKVRSIKSNNIF